MFSLRTRPLIPTAAAAPALVGPAAIAAATAPAPIVSDFEQGTTDGWTVQGDPGTTLRVVQRGFNVPNPPVNHGLEFSEGTADRGATDYFVAPDKFLGDLSAYFGGALTFYIEHYAQIDTPAGVVLAGPAGTLYGTVHEVPGSGGYLAFSLTSDTFVTQFPAREFTTPFSFNAPDGALATNAQIRSVLANVTSLRIRADYLPGQPEVNVLDDVRLDPAASPIPLPIPLPAAFPVALPALLALPLLTRRRRRLRETSQPG